MEDRVGVTSIWGAVCSDCEMLAHDCCPHCMKDYCEKHRSGHDCESLQEHNLVPG
jgi:hypothetical protein